MAYSVRLKLPISVEGKAAGTPHTGGRPLSSLLLPFTGALQPLSRSRFLSLRKPKPGFQCAWSSE